MAPRTQNLLSAKKEYIRWLKDTSMKDVLLVGGKNAALGEMYSKLTDKGIAIPNGFAVTAQVYVTLLEQNGLKKKMKELLKEIDANDQHDLASRGKKVRELIMATEFPKEITKEILVAYHQFGSAKIGHTVVVRSSVITDLPDIRIAGQQESYVNVHGDEAVLRAIKQCIASLFSNQAITYRETKGLDHLSFAIAIGVQDMVRSDLGASGTLSTIDSATGFPGVVHINASYGLGGTVGNIQGTSDQFTIFKEGIRQGKEAIVSRRLGTKETKLVSAKKHGTLQANVPAKERNRFAISNTDVMMLAKWGMTIEEHFDKAQDISWVKDGETGKLLVIQARPAIVSAQSEHATIETYILKKTGTELARGIAVGQKIGAGKVHVIENAKDRKQFKKGHVLVTQATDQDWEPAMRLASAIVTEQGDATSHAAIVARELGIPCVVGVEKVCSLLKTGQSVTVSCVTSDSGCIYNGILPFEMKKTNITHTPKTKTKVLLNVSDPQNAFSLSYMPNDGVGLVQEEHLFKNFIHIHPLALLQYDKVKDKKTKQQIAELTRGYKKKTDYCVDKLAEGISRIAVGMYPKPVTLRLSDFQNNEYVSLIGGKQFEPKEHNLMGSALRYADKTYKDVFRLECDAIKKARNDWGLKNIIVMVPFCRTPEEGEKLLNAMEEFGLKRGDNGLQVHVMCDIPSNVILAKEFAKLFDGFGIGASTFASHENNEVQKTMIKDVISVAHRMKRKISICGQTPREYPELTEFLVRAGIDGISLNPDTIVSTRNAIAHLEKTVGNTGNRTNAKFLSLVAGFGIACAGFIGLGAGCANMDRQPAVTPVVDISPAQLRQQIEAKIRQNQKELEQTPSQTLTVSTFADLTLQYPLGWEVVQWDGGLTVRNRETQEFVSMFKQLVDHPVPTKDRQQVTVGALTGERYETVIAGQETVQVIEVEVPDVGTLEIDGRTPQFDAIVQTIQFASVGNVSGPLSKEPVNGTPTHWDVREKRLCAQMITYARQKKTDQCVAYSTPCDVPDGWQVCDADDL